MVSPSPHFEIFIWRIISFRGWNGIFCSCFFIQVDAFNRTFMFRLVTLTYSVSIIYKVYWCGGWSFFVNMILTKGLLNFKIKTIFYRMFFCWENDIYIYVYIYNIHIICYFFYQLISFVYISIYTGKHYGNMLRNVFHWYTSRPNCIHGYITLVLSA